MLIAILHFFTDDQNPQGIVSSLVDARPLGSYFTITNLTADFMDPAQAAQATEAGQQGDITYVPRSEAEVAAFFRGLDVLDTWYRVSPAGPKAGCLLLRAVPSRAAAEAASDMYWLAASRFPAVAAV
jgi:hypothetical protein